MARQDKFLLALAVLGGRSRLGGRMGTRLAHGRTLSRRASPIGVAAAAIVLLAPGAAASRAPRWNAFAQQPSPALAFEAASVKPHDPADARRPLFQFFPEGRRVAFNIPLRFLIARACNLPPQSPVGGPARTHSQAHDIEASPEAGVFPSALSSTERTERAASMLCALLTDRFRPAVRRESAEMSAYALVAAKSGHKLHPANVEEKECVPATGAVCQGFAGGQGHGIHGRGVTMAELAGFLENWSDRPIVDRTGLNGSFDIDTEGWTPLVRSYGKEADGEDLSDPSRPSLFTLLGQLGWKLESRKTSVEAFGIDRVEPPEAN